MKNIAKMLLSSAILATGAMAADNVLLDVRDDLTNEGTINVVPNMAIKVTAGKWITNTGTINFKKALDGGETFKVLGTNDETLSGIKNKALEFVQIDGIPTKETARIDDANYYNIGGVAGTIQVQNSENPNEVRPLQPTDYVPKQGGTIKFEKCSLYNFLKDDNTAADKVIVLRGNADVTDNMILLNHNDAEDENDKTSEGEGVLEIKNPFVNSEDYEKFEKQVEVEVGGEIQTQTQTNSYNKSYALGINGYFTFTGTNTNFNQQSIEFMDGSSEFNTVESMFGTNKITISGGNVNINLNSGDPVVLSGKTINVTSHKVAEDNDVYGCLVVTAGNVVLDKTSELNLGYKDEAE